ncbi:MAG: CinA family nicotinamide mononucleotide deamidase-related protein [Myxococcaceae bacterium]|nr:CinA family nicotinamide mononucleotide deamidase-related protein [Myxococcaceae bacterium]
MRIETICTGDELLTGLTADTNSTFFQARLLETLGLQVQRNTVVGDVREELTAVMREVAARADVVLVSGGLGPTADDLTVECAAAAKGVGTERNEEAWRSIQARFAERGLRLSANNEKQAWVPKGSEVVINTQGSAPMFVMSLEKARLFFVPGVPTEYRHLVETEVLPRLRTLRGKTQEYRVLKLLKTMGLAESHLEEKVQSVVKVFPQVVFGYRTHPPENHLKLLAVASSPDGAADLAERAAAQCREALGLYLFGEGDDRYSQVVGRLLRARKETVAVAESCTAGNVAALLAQEPGASEYLLGGAVTYQAATKQQWAGVKAETLEKFGEVSNEVAKEMAEGVRAAAGASWGLATTGWAGPKGGTATDPVGTVYLACAGADGTHVRRVLLPGDRQRIQKFAAYGALDVLRRAMLR